MAIRLSLSITPLAMLLVVSCGSLTGCGTIERVERSLELSRWAYTYRIFALDPLVATAVRSCTFSEGELRITVTAEVDQSHERISGLWLAAPEIQDLALDSSS